MSKPILLSHAALLLSIAWLLLLGDGCDIWCVFNANLGHAYVGMSAMLTISDIPSKKRLIEMSIEGMLVNILAPNKWVCVVTNLCCFLLHAVVRLSPVLPLVSEEGAGVGSQAA